MRIGEVEKRIGMSQRMIRHYEQLGLVSHIARRRSGYRDYDEHDVATLAFIRRARDLGFPVGEIARLLDLWRDRSRASSEVKALALARAADLAVKAGRLEEMRASLLDLAARCTGDERPDCPILGGLNGGADGEPDGRVAPVAED